MRKFNNPSIVEADIEDDSESSNYDNKQKMHQTMPTFMNDDQID